MRTDEGGRASLAGRDSASETSTTRSSMNDDLCVICEQPTTFGSGRFVNRIPADDGWMCAECYGGDDDGMTVDEAEALDNIRAAIDRACELLNLSDVLDSDDETRETAYEERHHRGTCEVNTVLGEVWPHVEAWVRAVRR